MVSDPSHLRSRKSNQAGFSLIEVAIGLMVIGILMGGMIAAYNVYVIQRQENDTKNRILVVQAALQKYVTRYGEYPLPADRSILIGTAGFGKQVAAAPTAVCTVNQNTTCVTPTGDVYIGDVPFATLGIHYQNILDSYGGKLSYAVSKELTSQAVGTFSDTAGAIDVLAEDGTTIYPVGLSKAHYFVYSAGRDGQGSYGTSGALRVACGAAVNGTDTENCDGDNVFRSNYDDSSGTDTQGKFVRYFVNGTSQFDDYSGYQNTLALGYWTLVPNLGELINTNSGKNVLIGGLTSTCNAPPDVTCIDPPRTRIEVKGSVRAQEEFRTKRLCDPNVASGCTDPGAVYGTVSPGQIAGMPAATGAAFTDASATGTTTYTSGGILCGDDKPLWAFYKTAGGGQQLDELCLNTVKISNTTSFYNYSCPAGEYATGISAAGTILCGP